MVHMMHVDFMFFEVFTNLKSSFSEDNMPGHSLDIFIENHQNDLCYPIKKERSGSVVECLTRD